MNILMYTHRVMPACAAIVLLTQSSLVPNSAFGQDSPSASPSNLRPPIVDRAERIDDWRRRIHRLRPTLPYQRNHATVKTAFRDVVSEARRSTVEVFADGKQVSMGAIVSSDGYILTKASELKSPIQCRVYDRSYHAAEVVGIEKTHDLAMLKIEQEDLPVLIWDTSEQPLVGSWVATAGLSSLPQAIGVVSVSVREIPAARGVLGVVIDDADGGAIVQHVMPKGSAAQANVLKSDLITQLNDIPVRNRHDLVKAVQTYRPGDKVRLHILRDGKQQIIAAELGSQFDNSEGERIEFQKSLGGPLSKRRDGFPAVLEHDSVLRPEHCGGPLLNLDGTAIGLNIARASRVGSYALPTSKILPLIRQLKSGDLKPEETLVNAGTSVKR